MLRVAILDANRVTSPVYRGRLNGVVANWLAYECDQTGLTRVAPSECDLLFLVHAGALDWVEDCSRELRHCGISPDPTARRQRPYIITGGMIDASPFTALQVADGLAVGEAYRLVRDTLRIATSESGSISDVAAHLRAYPHAIERSQLVGLTRDERRPWLLAEQPERIASPDPYVDWSMPGIPLSDNVVRLLLSKGCQTHCAFCATSWRESYAVHDDPGRLSRQLAQLRRQKRRYLLISNDAAAVPCYRQLATELDSESFTMRALRDPAALQTLLSHGARMVRLGIEGVSERIRHAWGKPVANDELIGLLDTFQGSKVPRVQLFMIVGAPFETEGDWRELRELWQRICRVQRRGLCRVKFTAFSPTPPAPLSRFLPTTAYANRWAEFRAWYMANSASGSMYSIGPRQFDAQLRAASELLGVPIAALAEASDRGDIDLSPTESDARRMAHEVIDWPQRTAVRWRIAERYAERMSGMGLEPRLA